MGLQLNKHLHKTTKKIPPGDYDREGFLNAIETWVPNSERRE